MRPARRVARHRASSDIPPRNHAEFAALNIPPTSSPRRCHRRCGHSVDWRRSYALGFRSRLGRLRYWRAVLRDRHGRRYNKASLPRLWPCILVDRRGRARELRFLRHSLLFRKRSGGITSRCCEQARVASGMLCSSYAGHARRVARHRTSSVMPPDRPLGPAPLIYASAPGLSPRPKSLLEVIGLHYVAGLGATTLLSVFLLLLPVGHDYPVTSACGGTFVVVIQWALVALPAVLRQLIFRQLLVERRTRVTVACGATGGVLVFGIPYLLRNLATSDAVSACVTLVPLCVYPVVISFVVFRRGSLPTQAA